MKGKLLFSRNMIFNLLGLVVALCLLASLGLYLNTLFASRSQQQGPQTTAKSQTSPSTKQSSPTPTTTLNPTDLTGEWRVYVSPNYNFTIKYPQVLKAEELSLEAMKESGLTGVYAVKFYSPEATSNAIMPEEAEAQKQFVEQYIFVFLQVHDNPRYLPLKQFLQELYTKPNINPQLTIFDAMAPNLQPFRHGPQEGLIFVGNVGENPQKSVFLVHKDKVYEITLPGGAGGTGAIYSTSAERVFDSMVLSIEFQ